MPEEDRSSPGEYMRDPATPFNRRLRVLCGYVENASDSTVRVSQDDATKTWFVHVGQASYYGESMEEAFEKAFQDPKNDPEA